jgi:hypothetical protein
MSSTGTFRFVDNNVEAMSTGYQERQSERSLLSILSAVLVGRFAQPERA